MNIKQNVSLEKLNTFGSKITAHFFVEIAKHTDLQHLYRSELFQQTKKKIILGGGSNILFTSDVEGLVIKNNLLGIEKVKEDAEHFWVKVGGGENWHQFVLHCIKNDWQGIENLSLIPGTVGAAPVQNIGAYGVEAKDVLESVHFFSFDDAKFHTFSKSDCQFGYRNSIFKNDLKGKVFISEVVFKLNKIPKFNSSYGAISKELGKEKPTIKAISEAVVKIRESKLPDPEKIGNCGSFFKNPEILETQFQSLQTQFPTIPSYPLDENKVKVPAAWLIEQCGWKGKKVGKVGIHAAQALVIINLGGAIGKEAQLLSEQIQESVYAKFDIRLEAEVTIL